MPRHVLTAALLALALIAGGCGEDEPEMTEGGAPALTVGGEPYENGAADGSGADGEEEPAPRGGISAGPDTKEPGDDPDGDDDQQQQEQP
jgi:hypothetical protein